MMQAGSRDRRLFWVQRTGVAALLLAGVAMTACDSLITTPSRYGAIAVTAKRRNGDPIPGVQIMLYSGPRQSGVGQTNARGELHFDPVPVGAYGVYAYGLPKGYQQIGALTGEGGTDIKDGLTAGDSSKSEAHFIFVRNGPGAINVTVSQEDGKPSSGVPTTTRDRFGRERTILSDANGRAAFPNSEYGNYLVYVPNPEAAVNPAASPFIIASDVIVEDGLTEQVALKSRVCEGTLTARVEDDKGVPVAAFPLLLYVAAGPLSYVSTPASGTYSFSQIKCGVYGVALQPLTGWSYVDGRGSGFFDAISVTPGSSRALIFKVKKVP